MNWNVTITPSNPGLTISGNTISGKPNASGTYTVEATATNAAGSSYNSFVLNIAAQPSEVPAVQPKEDGSFEKDAAVNVQFEATNGPLTGWKFDGTIPDGLKFDPSTGVLSGSTSAVGTYTIQVYAQNKNGWSAGTIYSFKIKDSTVPTEPLALNSSSFEVTSGEAFTKSVLTVSGGEAPYFFEYTADAGKLDLNINASTGEFSSNGITVDSLFADSQGHGCRQQFRYRQPEPDGETRFVQQHYHERWKNGRPCAENPCTGDSRTGACDAGR